jgi:DNA repair protein RadA/Sms
MGRKAKTVFICQECGNESPKWVGQCICGAWNTMVEERVTDRRSEDSRLISSADNNAVKFSRVISGNVSRLNTGIGELNRVLGGGLVKGSLSLISGEPGIGKSTLILQAGANIAGLAGPVLYVSGEESLEQIKMRGDRVCASIPDDLFLLSETNIENVIKTVFELEPSLLIIDSIQTMYSDEYQSAQGSVSQVRACANELMRIGKGKNLPILIVAHVTKSGDLAGPKIIEHLVDCVLNFTGEREKELRILRAYKNRFGTTSEIGAFIMEEDGLTEVENLSGAFLDGMEEGAEGSMATAVYEGTRPLLLEVQALTSPTSVGFPRRTAIGPEVSRLNMILAVLDRKAGIPLTDKDVYVNIVGGLKPEGTSTDLAVALAVFSAYKGISGNHRTLAAGEIGLTGDLRFVANCDKIVKEASRLGFERILLPEKNVKRISDFPASVALVGIKNIRDAISIISRER